MASGLLPQLSSTLLAYDDAATVSAVVTRDVNGDTYSRRVCASATGGVYNSGGAKVGYEAKTTSFTAAATICFYSVDPTAGTVTATLPTAVGNTGLRFTFKKIVSANSMVITAAGAETIDGVLSHTFDGIYAVVTIVSNGANWLMEGCPPSAYVAKTASFTAANTNTVYNVSTAGGAVVATLLTAVGHAGARLTFKIGIAGNSLTIDGAGAETIDGAATKACSTLYASYTIISDGANWIMESFVATWT